jgi:hypothetical protein
MLKRSIITLFVLISALWGSFCFFSMHFLNLHNHDKQLFSSAKIRSTIVETNSIIDILPYVAQPNTLVIFDIDNTLAAPHGYVGSDQFTTYLLQQYLAEGMNEQEALNEVLPIVFEATYYVHLFPLEKETLPVLHYLKEHNIPMIALTSRSIEIADRTHEQLAEAGIFLQAPPVFNRQIYCNYEVPALYKDNIIFCAKNDKGIVLMHIFEEFNYFPDKIVYVDDKISYIISLEKECLKNNIYFIGIRYGYSDQQVKNFDPTKAQKEYEKLMGQTLSIFRAAH